MINKTGSHLNLIRSGILGVCVGDALGFPVQFKKRSYLKQCPIIDMTSYSFSKPKGTWSDDSSLTLCLADSLSRGYDLEDIANNFIKWYRKGFLTPDGIAFDIGKTTSASIRRIESGVQPEKAGGSYIEDNGNGSLMRILPLSFYLYKNIIDVDEKYKIVKDVSSITHGHIYSVVACYVYIDIAIELLHGMNIREAYLYVCNKNRSYYESLLDSNGIKEFSNIFSLNIETMKEEKISSTGYVIHSMEAALWCLLNSTSYSEAVLKAVNLGDDTDTVAAIAGGLAGINYGIESIPQRWIETLVKLDTIEDVCKRLSTNMKNTPSI